MAASTRTPGGKDTGNHDKGATISESRGCSRCKSSSTNKMVTPLACHASPARRTRVPNQLLTYRGSKLQSLGKVSAPEN